jgi:predicted kinase
VVAPGRALVVVERPALADWSSSPVVSTTNVPPVRAAPIATFRQVAAGPPAARPWLVVVTGEPGSGKTSLGQRLAGALRVPFLSRDAVRGGLLATAGLWTDEGRPLPERDVAVETFVRIVERMAGLGVSAVLEFVVFRERREALRRLQAAGRCLVVRTECTDAGARAEQRDRRDVLLRRPEVLRALGHGSIDDYLRGPQREIVRAGMVTDFDLPLLPVRTDDGYDPRLDDIVEWVIDRTRN